MASETESAMVKNKKVSNCYIYKQIETNLESDDINKTVIEFFEEIVKPKLDANLNIDDDKIETSPPFDIYNSMDKFSKKAESEDTDMKILMPLKPSVTNRFDNLEKAIEDLKYDHSNRIERLEKCMENLKIKDETKETLFLFCQFCDLMDDCSGKTKMEEIPKQNRTEIDNWRKRYINENFLKTIIFLKKTRNEICHPFDKKELFDEKNQPIKDAIEKLIETKKDELKNYEYFMSDKLKVKVEDFDTLFKGISRFLGIKYTPLKK